MCVCACLRAALAKDVCHVANNSDTACPEQRMAQRELVLQGQARVNTPFSHQKLLGQETVLSETRPSLEYDWGLPKLRGNGQRTRKRQPTNRSAERRQQPNLAGRHKQNRRANL